MGKNPPEEFVSFIIASRIASLECSDAILLLLIYINNHRSKLVCMI